MNDRLLKIHRPREDRINGGLVAIFRPRVAIFIRNWKLKLIVRKFSDLIRNDKNKLNHLVVLISDSRHILSIFEEHKLFKITRIKNLCAYLLTKNARKTQSLLQTFSEAPPCIYSAYMQELQNRFMFLAVAFPYLCRTLLVL